MVNMLFRTGCRAVKKIEKSKNDFFRRFGELLANQEFATALKAGDPYSFIRRVEMSRKLVREFI